MAIDNRKLADTIRTEVRVFGMFKESEQDLVEELKDSTIFESKSSILTINMRAAKLLLQQEGFNVDCLFISKGSDPEKLTWFALGGEISDEEKMMHEILSGKADIYGVMGTISGQPKEVAEKLRTWGIDDVDIVPHLETETRR